VPTNPLPFRGAPPDRTTWVLAQKTAFDSERWRGHLGDDAFLPPEFATLPLDDDGYRLITRQVVHTIAERATDALGALHTHVAAAAWGSGKRPARPRQIFDGTRERAWAVAETLHKAADVLRASGPVAAYGAMHLGGAANIPDLGPAYATKFLHYVGYARTRAGGRYPLILDSYVAIALNRLLNLGWNKFGWPAAQYDRYLDIAHDWAAEWGCAPDVVERVLFSIGQSRSLAIAALNGLPAR
jgi:hypothetical protein